MPNFLALDRLKADLDILRPLDKEQEARILQKFRLDWNYHSNAIEGNSLTLGETRSLLLHGLTAQGKPLRDHLDIRGHNDAVLWLEEIVRDDRPLTENFIREIHELLLGEPYYTPAKTPSGQPSQKRVEPGRYKTQPNNVVTTTGETFHFASPEETPARMTALIDWYRAEQATPTLHPVELAARFHYDFVRIHPFDDGNGRMSRLLMNLILLRHGYPMTVIKKDSRDLYIAALSQADADEMEPFLTFIAENVEASLQLMLRGARGESIEEPSDLDKKLALLRVQLLNDKTPPRLVWDLQTQRNFYEAFIISWADDLVAQSEKLNFAFQSKQFRIGFFSVDEKSKYNFRMSPVSTAITSLMKERFLVGELPIQQMKFMICWETFRQPIHFIDLSLNVRFLFTKSAFSIGYDILDTEIEKLIHQTLEGDNQIFQSSYLYQYDHARIQAINHQLATKVYDFIEAKLQEPPAA